MRILPGQLAFFFVLMMVPLVALVGSVVHQFSLPLAEVEATLSKVIPSPVIDMILPILTAKNMEVNLSIFYFSAFLLASNGTHSMIIASNSIYHVEGKGYLRERLKALGMAIVLVLLLVFVLLVPAFGDSLIDLLFKLIPGTSIQEGIMIIYQIVKYPISLFLIFLAVITLYCMAPDKKLTFKETAFGALITAMGWLLVTEVFSTYVSLFLNYDVFYGSIANILILLLWVYVLAYIFVFGMAINSSGESPNNE